MKQGATLTKGIIVMMLLALIAYGIAAAVSSLEKTTATAAAIAYEVGDGFQATGFVVRDEQVLYAPEGINVLLCGEGERVAKGQPLAATFADAGAQQTQLRIDELEQELERIDAVLASAPDVRSTASLDTRLQETLLRFTAMTARGDLADADAGGLKTVVLSRFLDEAGRAELRGESQSMREELAALRASLAGAVTQSAAAQAGFFSGSADGYERLLSRRGVQSMTVRDYDALLQERPEAPARAIGRLITSPEWYYLCQVRQEDLKDLRVGDWLTVEFAFDVYEPLRMKVERLSDALEGRQVLTLSCSDHMELAARLRTQQADVILHTYSGIRVPKQALYYVNDTGESGVYVLEGAVARWKPVEILYEAQEYYLVREDRSSTSKLWAGDEVLLTGQELTDGKVVE